MKRTILATSSGLALIALSMMLGGAGVGAAGSSSTAVIIFDDVAQQAKLIIPTPACPAPQPDCQWKFFLNEPKLSVDVSIVYGTSGTLTLDYPKNFCGVIQADAYIGPPWVAKRGFQHTVADCNSVTTTTAASVTSTSTDQHSPSPSSSSTTTTTTTVEPFPGSAAGSSEPPPAAPVDAPPVGSAPSSTGASTSGQAGTAQDQLPFTGLSATSYLLVGLTLVACSGLLLTTVESRRRMGRRIGNCPWPLSGAPSKRR